MSVIGPTRRRRDHHHATRRVREDVPNDLIEKRRVQTTARSTSRREDDEVDGQPLGFSNDRLSRSVGANEAARETKTPGLHFRARMLECLARTTLCVEHVSFEREFRREFDDENADERAAVRRRERACAREGMKRLGIRAERYEDPPVDRVCFRA